MRKIKLKNISWKAALIVLLVGCIIILGSWYSIFFLAKFLKWNPAVVKPLYNILIASWCFFWGAIYYRKIPYPYKFIMLGVVLMFIIFSFAEIYQNTGLIDKLGSQINSKSICIYFSISTFTTLGIGDFYPTTESRIFTAIEVLMGYLFFGVFIGIVAAYVGQKIKQEERKPYTPML